LSGTGIGVQALSPSMKKMRPPELPSTLAKAALSPYGRPGGVYGFIA
jgi:hypothetical protein